MEIGGDKNNGASFLFFFYHHERGDFAEVFDEANKPSDLEEVRCFSIEGKRELFGRQKRRVERVVTLGFVSHRERERNWISV